MFDERRHTSPGDGQVHAAVGFYNHESGMKTNTRLGTEHLHQS